MLNALKGESLASQTPVHAPSVTNLCNLTLSEQATYVKSPEVWRVLSPPLDTGVHSHPSIVIEKSGVVSTRPSMDSLALTHHCHHHYHLQPTVNSGVLASKKASKAERPIPPCISPTKFQAFPTRLTRVREIPRVPINASQRQNRDMVPFPPTLPQSPPACQ